MFSGFTLYNWTACGNELYLKQSLNFLDKSVLSSKLDKYSLNDNGNIFISIYLPVSNVANFEDNKYAFEPVIYKSTSLFIIVKFFQNYEKTLLFY